MQEKLRNLRTSNDPFWTELTRVNPRHQRPATSAIVVEDMIPDLDNTDELDDTDVSLHDIIAATHQKDVPAMLDGRIASRENGGLMTTTDAENLDEIPKSAEEGEGGQRAEEEGRGKRKKKANMLYRLEDFARHWDNETSDVE